MCHSEKVKKIAVFWLNQQPSDNITEEKQCGQHLSLTGLKRRGKTENRLKPGVDLDLAIVLSSDLFLLIDKSLSFSLFLF